jgi:hypothetical protein
LGRRAAQAFASVIAVSVQQAVGRAACLGPFAGAGQQPRMLAQPAEVGLQRAHEALDAGRE